MAKVKMRLHVLLQDKLIGELEGYPSEKITFTFNNEFISTGPARHTLSLSMQDPKNELLSLQKLQKKYISNQKIPTFFSNLLPEGFLRKTICKQQNISSENELPLLATLGNDLSGAVTVKLLEGQLKKINSNMKLIDDSLPVMPKFSLAGVQLKFSMLKEGEHYTLKSRKMGNWIVKPPSDKHAHLPANEYSCMKLAEAIGVEIPEVKLVPAKNIESLPEYFTKDETVAYAIKRFDRLDDEKKIHVEDFAQILSITPDEKYEKDAGVGSNLASILLKLQQFSPYPVQDQQQVIKRVLANLLLGNTDAHLKNWSVIYYDGRLPRLAPAYDILFTKFYTPNDRTLAMKIGEEKELLAITKEHFMQLAELADMNARTMQITLEETLEKARALWPDLLEQLPMQEQQKMVLKKYWQELAIKFY